MQDTIAVLSDAFESDWGHSKAEDYIRRAASGAKLDPDSEVDKAREYLRSKYWYIKDMFKQYAASTTESFTMALNAFSDFINDCDFADNGPCSLANLDMFFIGSNMLGYVKIQFSE